MPLSNFTAAEWAKLPQADRIAECRRMSEEARELSNSASGELKRAYCKLAADWNLLADEMMTMVNGQ